MNYELMYDEAMLAAQVAGFVGFSPAAVIFMQHQLIENDNTTMQELVAERDALRKALSDIYSDVYQGAIPNADDEWWLRAKDLLENATGESPST